MSAVTEERCSYKRRGTVPLTQEPSGPRSLLIMLPLLLLLSLLLASAVLPRHAAPVLKVSLCSMLSPTTAFPVGHRYRWGEKAQVGREHNTCGVCVVAQHQIWKHSRLQK